LTQNIVQSTFSEDGTKENTNAHEIVETLDSDGTPISLDQTIEVLTFDENGAPNGFIQQLITEDIDRHGEVSKVTTDYIEATVTPDGTVCHADTFTVVDNVKNGEITGQVVINDPIKIVLPGTHINEIMILIPDIENDEDDLDPSCLTEAEIERLEMLGSINKGLTLDELIAQ